MIRRESYDHQHHPRAGAGRSGRVAAGDEGSGVIYGIACNPQVDQILRDNEARGNLESPVGIVFDWKLPRIIDPRLKTDASEVYYDEKLWRLRLKQQNEWDEATRPNIPA